MARPASPALAACSAPGGAGPGASASGGAPLPRTAPRPVGQARAGAQPRRPGPAGGQGRRAARRTPAGGRDQPQDGGGAGPAPSAAGVKPSAAAGGRPGCGRTPSPPVPRGLLPLSGAAFPGGSGTSTCRPGLLPRAATCPQPAGLAAPRRLPAEVRRLGAQPPLTDVKQNAAPDFSRGQRGAQRHLSARARAAALCSGVGR